MRFSWYTRNYNGNGRGGIQTQVLKVSRGQVEWMDSEKTNKFFDTAFNVSGNLYDNDLLQKVHVSNQLITNKNNRQLYRNISLVCGTKSYNLPSYNSTHRRFFNRDREFINNNIIPNNIQENNKIYEYNPYSDEIINNFKCTDKKELLDVYNNIKSIDNKLNLLNKIGIDKINQIQKYDFISLCMARDFNDQYTNIKCQKFDYDLFVWCYSTTGLKLLNKHKY